MGGDGGGTGTTAKTIAFSFDALGTCTMMATAKAVHSRERL